MIEIDGSYGEGGGQILRTALGLSCLLGRPFRIYNLRTGRKKPGLMPQHLMCVQALKLLSDARVEGDYRGSTELVFEPARVKGGDYLFDIGTAGSTSLLLQALLPPLIYTDTGSSITLKGGTHVPFSPPFHYIRDVFVPILGRTGIRLKARIESCGFYPRGGGRIDIDVYPGERPAGISLTERGEIRKITGISGVGNLPISIAERQRDAASRVLKARGFRPEIEVVSVPTPGKGTFLFLKAEAENTVAGFTSIGERGKRAETVGEEAAEGFLGYYSTSASLDPNMADQIVPYLAVADGESSFTTSRISEHLLTNLWVTERFSGITYRVEGRPGSPGRIMISGRGDG
jgi:RNA 3'-terminal phosphate cyclase (ATP)